MKARFDAVVLGADLEGLAAAATLAHGGLRVLVVDAAARPGGLAAREEFHPGYQVCGSIVEVGAYRRALLGPLCLHDFGLTWERESPTCLVQDEDGAGVLLERGGANLPAALARDAQAWARWRAFQGRVRPLVNALLDAAPPEVFGPSAQDLWELATRGLQLRRLGKRDMFELMRIGPLAAADLLDDRFECGALKVALAAPALLGTVLGPRAAGTGALLFARECAVGPEPVGGPAGLVDALLAACRKAGCEMRLETEVARLGVEHGEVRGIELSSGEQVDTPRVLSSLSPRRTLLDWVPPRQLPAYLESSAQNWRARGAVALARVALSSTPEFQGAARRRVDRAWSARSLDELERCADALKYGELPELPWIDVHVPSATDPSLAPAGHAVLSVTVHGVPANLRGGWNDAARTALEASLWRALERLLPGVRERVVAAQVLTPPELEQRYSLGGGHVFQGELALDQLWIQRPSVRLARYATEIRGLYLGSSANHPGGPFPCGAGVLAARAALRESRERAAAQG